MLARFVGGFLGEGTCSTGTEASMTGKNGSTIPDLGVSKLGNECQCSTGSNRCLCWGWGREMPPACLPVEPCPSGTHSEMPWFFKLLLLHCISVGCLSCFVFKGGGLASSHPPALPEPNLLIFKVPGFKSSSFKFGASGFQSQMLWGFIFPV